MPGFFISWSPCSVDGSFNSAATSVWHSTQRSAIVPLCQKKAWHAEHLPPISAWEVTPPRTAPDWALSGPGLKSTPPRTNPTTTTTSITSRAVTIPGTVRQPNGFLSILSHLSEQRGVSEGCPDVNKSSNEQGYPDWNVDRMPDGQHAPGAG